MLEFVAETSFPPPLPTPLPHPKKKVRFLNSKLGWVADVNLEIN